MEAKKIRFQKKEFDNVLITSLIIGFVMSFSRAGEDQFIAEIWLKNFLLFTIIGLVLLTILNIVVKYLGYRKGYFMNYEQHPLNYLLSMIVTIASGGVFNLFLIGYYDPEINPLKRIGQTKKEQVHLGEVSNHIIGGVVILLIISTILKYFFMRTNNFLLEYLLLTSTYMAIFTLIPLPFNNGIFVFFDNKIKFISMFVFTLIYGIILLNKETIDLTTILFVIIFTGVIVYAYIKNFEK